MNTETKNRPVRRAAVVVGFVALLVLIAWLSIMIVKNVPGSFASLASLAESVRSFDASQDEIASDDEASRDDMENMLIVTSDTNVIETGQNVRLSWTDTSSPGTFVFSYKCTEGVSIEIIESDGVRAIDCGTNYNLGDVTDTTLSINSERERYADVQYSLSFLESNNTEPHSTDIASITIVNDDVPLFRNEFAAADTEEVEVTANEDQASEPNPTVVAVPEEVPETNPSETTSSDEQVAVLDTDTTETTVETSETTAEETDPVVDNDFTQEFTYTIPVSDPNGRIDLATRFIDTGSIVSNTFVAGTLATDAPGAIQFEVKNLGTKTSETWTYSVTLPTGGTIESTDQEPLKPNERAVITIGFPAVELADFDFEVAITTSSDFTSINDQFVESVSFNQ